MKYTKSQINAYINEFCAYDEELGEGTKAAETMAESELKALCEAIDINEIKFDENNEL